MSRYNRGIGPAGHDVFAYFVLFLIGLAVLGIWRLIRWASGLSD